VFFSIINSPKDSRLYEKDVVALNSLINQLNNFREFQVADDATQPNTVEMV